MGYKITVTDLALKDLRNIIDYISNQLANPSAASSFLDSVAHCYNTLESMPFAFEQCRDSRLRKLGYRRYVIKKYVMVYRVSEEDRTVYILRFFYGAQDYEKLI